MTDIVYHIVLVEPEIPPNTGNIGRLCLATDSTLHLVEPLGFSLDDRSLQRAGLDYWQDVRLKIWPDLDTLLASEAEARFFFLTTKTDQPYWSAIFQSGDFLVFGRESKGLPESLLARFQDQCLTIPMQGTRSLNLATAVAVVLYEAVRQTA